MTTWAAVTGSQHDIYRKQWSLLDDREIVDEALGELLDGSWLPHSAQSAGFQIRTHVCYRVNPDYGGV